MLQLTMLQLILVAKKAETAKEDAAVVATTNETYAAQLASNVSMAI